MPRAILVVTLVPLLAIFTGCATNDTSLGEVDQSGRVVDPGTSGPNEDGGIGSGAQDGTCLAPALFPVSDDAWWQAAWSPSLPAIGSSSCGSGGPAVVGVWTAPADGEYYARGWSDFKGIFSGAPECGGRDQQRVACAWCGPTTLPGPPWDARAHQDFGGGFGTIEAKAGDRWFFWFQYRDENNAPPPDSGIAIANVSTTSFW
jgi:hypothetical protein